MIASMHKELGVVAPFALKRQLQVVAGDDRKTLDLAMRAVTTIGLDPKDKRKVTHDARQEMLFIRMVTEKIPVLVVRFGGGHSWKETIDDWKLHNPNVRIALIEVTPNSYTADASEKGREEKDGPNR